MRLFKSLVSLPLKDSLNLVWSRITLSKITVFYFLFSFLHAILQIILQAEVFSVNQDATNLIDGIVKKGNQVTNGFTILQSNDLLWCTDPTKVNTRDCKILWTMVDKSASQASDTENMNANQYNALTATLSFPSQRATSTQTDGSVTVRTSSSPPTAVTATSTAYLTLDQEEEVVAGILAEEAENSISKREDGDITALNAAAAEVLQNPTCVRALNWPLETLRDTKREDIVFLFFHVWVLGMSIVAILNESIVHMIATLVTHALLTAWSISQILTTRAFQNNFHRIITGSVCSGTHLLPDYWKQRTAVEIPAAALNGAALLLSAFLTWRLVVTYNWATFKRIGANRKVSKTYKMVLTFSVTLQLSLFFIIVAMALWIDQLCNGAIGMFAQLMTLYRGVYITILCFLVPWIVVGWKAVRVESRKLMVIFLIFDLMLVGGWASMFASTTFKLTFQQWRFFSIMSVVAVFLILSCMIFGIICRMNFGNDLKRHLNGEETIPDGFVNAMPNVRQSVYSYEEKVAFPDATLPTFGRVTTKDSASTQYSSPFTLTRTSSNTSDISGPIIVPTSRFSFDSNDGEVDETSSEASHKRNGSVQSKRSKRWIIE